MDYEDFVIQLGTDAGAPTVRVARSPAGSSDPEPLLLHLSDAEIVGLATGFTRSAEASRQGRDLTPPEVTEPSLADIGARLFRALFPETVRDRYQQSLGRAAVNSRGLRLRIEVGLNNAGLARLHAIPWEYLAADGHFLALSREISIVRHLSLGLPEDRPLGVAPLSILILAGESLTGSGIDLERELLEIVRAWSLPGDVRIKVLPECTLDALREELLAQEYWALHFMGHGSFFTETEEGNLAFLNKDGQRIWVSGVELADHLRDRRSLRLVFLNACKTGQVGARAPYAGVATALADAGISAILAMQFPISDAAALTLSRTFYRRIARGDSMDAAVAEGRIAIRGLARNNTEWGTPVLFERLTNGQAGKPLNRQLASPDRSRFKSTAALTATVLAIILGLAWFKFSPHGEPFTAKPQPVTKPSLSAGLQPIANYQGCVRDSETNKPIKGVAVSALARSDIPPQQTDDRGNFELTIPVLVGERGGEIKVQFLREGYEERNEHITVVGSRVDTDILLTPRKKAHIEGPKLPSLGSVNVFKEYFADNRNHWPIYTDEAGRRVEVKGGHYDIYPGLNASGFFATIPLKINPDKDFEINCQIQKIDGPDNFFFGLVWGYKDSNNFFNIDITGAGGLAITRKANGSFYDYLDPRRYESVNTGNSTNTLSVRKKGNDLKLFVNGYLVHGMPFEPFFGSDIGFNIYDDVHVIVDYIVMTSAR
ncbi:MAG TPA: CHAT domain-containing protein [Thermoanaerobaculia bacterium]|jgi:hypothetical protein|nr:CHAT domain-containing protein [Thermoanaerobaculia bacterium]